MTLTCFHGHSVVGMVTIKVGDKLWIVLAVHSITLTCFQGHNDVGKVNVKVVFSDF